MKKKYVTPGFAVEMFTLTQSVAANCNAAHTSMGTPTHASVQTCGWNDGLDVLFISDGICDIVVEEDGVGGFCYNEPTGNLTVFNS